MLEMSEERKEALRYLDEKRKQKGKSPKEQAESEAADASTDHGEQRET